MTSRTAEKGPSSGLPTALGILCDRLVYFLRRQKNAPRRIAAQTHVDLVELLRRDGYAVLPGFYDDAQCARMIEEIDRIMTEQQDVVRRDGADADHRVFGAERASEAIAQFHSDGFLLSVGQSYYGNDLRNFSTLAGRIRFQPGNLGSGQGWHRDAFHFQYKAMVYLTDVGPQNGAFQILAGSHRALQTARDTFTAKLSRPPHSRITDDQAGRLIAARPERLHTLTAQRGTVIIFDSSAIHRGSPIRDGIRYALTNYYFQPEHITDKRHEEFMPFARSSAR